MAAPDRGFAEAVLAIVDAIPAGKVMTYGDVAAALDSRAARGVGQVMAYYGEASPWWRVLGHEVRALEHYRAEGTPIISTLTEAGYRVDYAAARYKPWV